MLYLHLLNHKVFTSLYLHTIYAADVVFQCKTHFNVKRKKKVNHQIFKLSSNYQTVGKKDIQLSPHSSMTCISISISMNTPIERQDKHICIYKNIQTFIYIIYIPIVLKRKKIQMCPNGQKYTQCSMNQQYEEGIKEVKKKIS